MVCQGSKDQGHLPYIELVQPGRLKQMSDRGVLDTNTERRRHPTSPKVKI